MIKSNIFKLQERESVKKSQTNADTDTLDSEYFDNPQVVEYSEVPVNFRHLGLGKSDSVLSANEKPVMRYRAQRYAPDLKRA